MNALFAASATIMTLLALVVAPSNSYAWGAQGHKVVALIAKRHLTETARGQLAKLLEQDDDVLTEPDLASRAVWADRYRESHTETGRWHFIEMERDGSTTPSKACERGCVVERLEYFERLLSDKRAPMSERLVALKFVLHFAGDITEPLHADGDHDSGGNCVHVLYRNRVHSLHEIWDDETVRALGRDPERIAAALDASLTLDEFNAAQTGTAADWARQSKRFADSVAFRIKTKTGCVPADMAIPIDDAYLADATRVSGSQLKIAGVRLAMLLNRALQ